MMIVVRTMTGDEIASRLDEIAALRVVVLAGWPYLYATNVEYERAYLSPYWTEPQGLVLGAIHGSRLVGMCNAIPLEMQSCHIVAAFRARDEAPETILYLGQPMILPTHRARSVTEGFFDHAEAWARALGRRHIAFFALVRPDDHPAQRAVECPAEDIWTARGYSPVPGVVGELAWCDVGASEETSKPLQFWMRTLQ
ncbi:GNAT family N-acetyltransferase [Paracoccus suum]|uniref:GNAT family N-acetyltransferase n=1 Tax=Paracoccus suum TaxID=2259340 RepID=A0A344PKL6_9RHOB|nr:GNAT family N-acetyltransferase [Paracoccus suum]AXC49921.1 GNAT family N-acetyltransferase [Paracoccus suum]